MIYQIPSEIKQIIDKVSQSNFQIYLVGGAVRDLIMGRSVDDWDFTTDAKPEEILSIFPEGFYDNAFGTVGIKVDLPNNPSSIIEITTMRKEGVYKDFRHPEKVMWTNKIEEDLARRDFTINALALRLSFDKASTISSAESLRIAQGKPDKYEIIDPFNGQTNLENKIIKAVGDPNKRFNEDALRLIRAIRIAAQLGFDIDSQTYSAIKQNAKLISQIAPERVREELFKLLVSPNPYIGIVQLREVGILRILLPELEKCFGVLQQGPKHARSYDIGEHSQLTLKETVSNDPIVKLAALLHDIGKPDTYHLDPDDNATFYQHDVAGGRLALQIAKRYNLSKKQTDKLYRLVRWHLYTVDEKQTDAAIRRFIKNVGRENIEDMLALRIGDRLGGGTEKPISWRMDLFRKRIDQVLQKPFSITDLKVNGNDVMEVLNIPPSRKVGEILDKLFQEVLEDSSKNNREYLLKRTEEIA